MHSLGRRTGIASSVLASRARQLTRHLDRLEELGLFGRNRDGADRRYALVELTPAGQALCHELDAIARAANDRLLSGFSADETAQLKSMLQRLTGNASKNSQD